MRIIRKSISHIIEKYRLLQSIKTVMYLKLRGARVGSNVRIWGPISCSGNLEKLTIGNNVTLNTGVFIGCRDFVEIGSGTTISGFTRIITGKLVSQRPKIHSSERIKIGENVWVAVGCTILAGANIGSNSLISAGCIVTKEIPRNSFVKMNSKLKIMDNKLE